MTLKANLFKTLANPLQGHHLALEARRLRARALGAHREAAGRILEEVNAGNPAGNWELDMHGLHVDEALEALQQRLEMLEEQQRAPFGR